MSEPPVGKRFRTWKYLEVRSPDGRLRFATIDVDRAVEFVENFYYRSKKRDKVPTLCSITEVTGKQEI